MPHHNHTGPSTSLHPQGLAVCGLGCGSKWLLGNQMPNNWKVHIWQPKPQNTLSHDCTGAWTQKSIPCHVLHVYVHMHTCLNYVLSHTSCFTHQTSCMSHIMYMYNIHDNCRKLITTKCMFTTESCTYSRKSLWDTWVWGKASIEYGKLAGFHSEKIF